ncbi:MAG: asparagine synthetase B, partial [Nitrospiraceae bacterium]|nr:asparagine synthetase B [Nitrospiraceae bacterium]
SAIPQVIGAIESTNPVAVGIGICMYFVSQCAHTNGIRFLVTGQGADELFAGYKRYEQAFDDGILDHELEKDVLALPAQIKRDVAVAQLNHVELYMPMLDLVDIATRIDVKLKMHKEGSNYIRKYILRKVSEQYLPAELVWAPKKAVQYGTGIQNALHRMARKRGLGQEDLLRQYSPDKLV